MYCSTGQQSQQTTCIHVNTYGSNGLAVVAHPFYQTLARAPRRHGHKMGGDAGQEAAWEAQLHEDLALPGALAQLFVDADDACDPDVGGVAAAAAESLAQLLLDDLGEEDPTCRQQVYLGTASRVLPHALGSTDLIDISDLTREDVEKMVRRACDDPLVPAGRRGRRRGEQGEGGHGRVDKILVVREEHASGEPHFHWALKLFDKLSFAPIKHTLRERNHVATHWSCSHTQFWSASRYLVVPSTTKAVDKKPHVWTWDHRQLDLFAEAQEPWMAKTWKRRREACELEAAAGTCKKAKFTKLDLTSLVLEKSLMTKPLLLEFSQDHGSAPMQLFVHQNQRKLKELIEDAEEWGRARQAAKAERESDWDVVCRFANAPCELGTACNYTEAADRIFSANEKHGLSREALAVALRKIIMNGPSKTTRVPVLVGYTNTGKTTLIVAFDKVFGFRHVFHKPALGSRYALRNILKDKRFLLWDDYRPVQYGIETVPVATFLSLFTGNPFEVQMSQSFNDGNEDFEWRRGCLMTAKEKDLWKPMGCVDTEDVEHIKSRCDIFPCREKIANLKDTSVCPHCMCKWIYESALANDARTVLQPLLPLAAGLGTFSVQQWPGQQQQPDVIAGFSLLLQAARLSQAAAQNLQKDLVALGAIDVAELTASDWLSCTAFMALRPLEQRRLMNALPAQPQP